MSGTVEYSSNNSGGSWWLDDADWYALEHQGWMVQWYEDEKDGMFVSGDRFLGALATRASKEFETFEEGIQEWENLTGQNAASIGCNCCGEPHYFTWTGDDGLIRRASVASPETGVLDFY